MLNEIPTAIVREGRDETTSALNLKRFECRDLSAVDLGHACKRVESFMQCPQCQTEMTEGVAQVRGDWVTFALVGYSLQDLWFDDPEGRTLILGSREKRHAYYCKSCGGLFVPKLEVHPRRTVDPNTGVVTEHESPTPFDPNSCIPKSRRSIDPNTGVVTELE